MTHIFRDIRYTIRVMRKSPGFTTVIVLTLALGVGANTAIFSVVKAVLLRPFPFHQPERLAVAWEIMPQPNDQPMFLSPPNFADWRDRNRSFESLSAFAPSTFSLATGQEAVRVEGARITANLLATLGVAPLLGRGFAADDDAPGATPVVLVSQGLWQGRLGGNPDIVGSLLRLDGVPHEVVGVMPSDFQFPPPIDLEGNTIPRRTDLWVPFADDFAAGQRSAHFMTAIGRLAPGSDVATATADVNRVAQELATTFPASNEGWTARVVPLDDVVLGNLRPALFVLLMAVTGVLLIACVNVANLLLSRATARQKEYAIRAALGAGRQRLLGHAVVESQVLALLGGAAGLCFAWVGTRLLVRIAPGNVPRLDQAGIDPGVILYALGLSVLTGLLFGLVPALRSFTPDLVQWLKQGGRTAGAGDSQGRLRDTLVVVEVGLSLLLLVSAALLFRSFLTLRGVDPGFRAEQVMTLRVTLPRDGYSDAAARSTAFAAIEERVRALPGVDAAGFIMDLPLASDYQGTSLVIEGEPPPLGGTNLVQFSFVTPGYFSAMGIPVLSGRLIDDRDQDSAEPTVVLNEAAAHAYFPGADPVGRRIEWGGLRRIVGIVGDVRLESIADEPMPAMYMAYSQQSGSRGLSLVVRSRSAVISLADDIREVVRDIDPNVPISDVKSMDQILTDALAAPRFSSVVLLAFSLAALLLAAIGIYGVISFATSMRTRELGVRMALGARPADAMGLVIGHAVRLTALGVMLGVAAALAFTRALGSLLFGVEPADPFTIAGVSVFLVAVGALAGAVPAWRASRVNPVSALRYE